MGRKERQRRQDLEQFSPANTAGGVPAASNLRAAPDTVPKLLKKKASVRHSTMPPPAATVPDHVMEDQIPETEPEPAPETELETVPEVDDPWL